MVPRASYSSAEEKLSDNSDNVIREKVLREQLSGKSYEAFHRKEGNVEGEEQSSFRFPILFSLCIPILEAGDRGCCQPLRLFHQPKTSRMGTTGAGYSADDDCYRQMETSTVEKTDNAEECQLSRTSVDSFSIEDGKIIAGKNNDIPTFIFRSPTWKEERLEI